jgi:hypothetical protein
MAASRNLPVAFNGSGTEQDKTLAMASASENTEERTIGDI